MTRYVTLRETLEALSECAPKAWCKRLLLQLMFDGSLLPFAATGHLSGRVPISVLIPDSGLAPIDGDRFWQKVADVWSISAPKESDVVKGYLAPVTGFRWDANDDISQMHCISFGYFHYADSVDWNSGEIIIDSIFPNEVHQEYFSEDDLMFIKGSQIDDAIFSWLDFSVHLTGVCFDRNMIELIADFGSRSGERAHNPLRKRATKWDWEGAMTAVVALANSPDGISGERGSQAEVERAMAGWFTATVGEQPDISLIRKRAQIIMNSLAQKA